MYWDACRPPVVGSGLTDLTQFVGNTDRLVQGSTSYHTVVAQERSLLAEWKREKAGALSEASAQLERELQYLQVPLYTLYYIPYQHARIAWKRQYHVYKNIARARCVEPPIIIGLWSVVCVGTVRVHRGRRGRRESSTS